MAGFCYDGGVSGKNRRDQWLFLLESPRMEIRVIIGVRVQV